MLGAIGQEISCSIQVIYIAPLTIRIVSRCFREAQIQSLNPHVKVAMTPRIVLWNGGFDTLSSPPLADNDVNVAETELKEGEWQNISWLPFHLNTSIKARGRWMSGVASAPDTDSPGFMQQKKFNVYCFGDLLDPRPDRSRLKILHVRYITLQQRISTANSQRHSFHPA